jgi:hypothetical protein
MNLEKEFVPYEQSLALKELGFDEPCFAFYNGKFIQSTEFDFDSYNSINVGPHPLAPTFSQAFRWFREKYNLDSWIQPFTSEKSNGVLYLPDESYSYFIFKDGVWVDDKVDFSEPEEAELACLIKLIEIAKENKQ